jgi:hypothetical protein
VEDIIKRMNLRTMPNTKRKARGNEGKEKEKEEKGIIVELQV